LQTEIPKVLKHRERLKRLVSDRNVADQNYNKSTRTSSLQSSLNSQVGATKDELDQANLRMEQCRVSLSPVLEEKLKFCQIRLFELS